MTATTMTIHTQFASIIKNLELKYTSGIKKGDQALHQEAHIHKWYIKDVLKLTK